MSDQRTQHHGRCLACGDEWTERGEIVVCPECHSRNVVETSGGVQRKYALTRVRPGDYLLPSNDGQTLWRIYSYEEDGSLVNVNPDGSERKVLGTFWACSRRPMPQGDVVLDDDDFWYDGWQHWAGPLRTRREAIDEAMRALR